MSQTQPHHEIEPAGAAHHFGFGAEAERLHEMTEQKPSAEEIAAEAYAIYLANGAQDGHAMDDWLEAERRLMAQRRSTDGQQLDAVVQHGNGESRQRPTRPMESRRRGARAEVPNYIPV